MSQYLMRRMLLFIPTMLLATIMVFALFSIVPGDAAVFPPHGRRRRWARD